MGQRLTRQWNRPGVVYPNHLTLWWWSFGRPRTKRWWRDFKSGREDDLWYAKGASRKPRKKVLRAVGRVIKYGRLKASPFARNPMMRHDNDR